MRFNFKLPSVLQALSCAKHRTGSQPEQPPAAPVNPHSTPPLSGAAGASTFARMKQRLKLQKKRDVPKPATLLDLVVLSNTPDAEAVTYGEFLQIVRNSATEYRFSEGGNADTAIRDTLEECNAHPAANRMPMQRLRELVTVLGETIHASQHASGPDPTRVSDAPRDTARMPTECIIHWIATLDESANGAANDAERKFYSRLLDDAKDKWLQHKLTFADARTHFEMMKAYCESSGKEGLAKLALELRNALPEPAPGTP